MSAILKEVARSVSNAPIVSDLEKLSIQLWEAQTKRDQLFGIEIDAKRILNDKIKKLERELKKSQIFKRMAGKYLPIDMSCLSWRDENGLPKLTLFDIDRSEFFISAVAVNGKPWNLEISYHIPKELRSYYTDVKQLLEKRSVSLSQRQRFDRFKRIDRRANCFISSSFSGVIPDSTREKIKEARSVFQEDDETNIFIMGDPVYTIHDDIELVSVGFGPDPLVLGYAESQLFLIDEFDISPIEEAVLLQPFKG